MSSSKNQLSRLVDQLSSSNLSNLNLSKFIQPLVLTEHRSGSPTSSVALSSLGLKSLSEGASEKSQSIQFGKPSSNATSSSSGSTLLSGLLSQTASGGVASLVSGGLSSFAGLGGLISGITSLFGGSSKAAPPPLVLFSLPDSTQQTVYVNSNRATEHMGNGAAPAASSAIYTTSGVVNQTSQTAVSGATDSSFIAQAVKNALLTSNSLGDVIAEI